MVWRRLSRLAALALVAAPAVARAGEIGDDFGRVIAADGERVAIPAPLGNYAWFDGGAVDIYHLREGTWRFEQRVTPIVPETFLHPARRRAGETANPGLDDDHVRRRIPLRRCFLENPGVAGHDPSRDFLVPWPRRVRHDRPTMGVRVGGKQPDGLVVWLLTDSDLGAFLFQRRHPRRGCAGGNVDVRVQAFLTRNSGDCPPMIAGSRGSQMHDVGSLSEQALDGIARPDDLECRQSQPMRFVFDEQVANPELARQSG
jgi:hypothetical protein